MTRRRCPRHVSQGENRKSSSPQCCWLGQHVFCPLLSRPCSRASETPMRLILVLFFTENGVKSLAPILASPPCAHAYAWLLTGSATPLQQGQNAATVTMNELHSFSAGRFRKRAQQPCISCCSTFITPFHMRTHRDFRYCQQTSSKKHFIAVCKKTNPHRNG